MKVSYYRSTFSNKLTRFSVTSIRDMLYYKIWHVPVTTNSRQTKKSYGFLLISHIVTKLGSFKFHDFMV